MKLIDWIRILIMKSINICNKSKINTLEIELELYKYFNNRLNIIVTNVWWGLNLAYECDMVVFRKTGYAIEIEIKTSKSDLIRDKYKKVGAHNSNLFKEFYFAVPEYLLEEAKIHCPEKAGIIIVSKKNNHFAVEKVRMPKQNKNCIVWNKDKMLKLAHLGCMRNMTLKQKILKLEKKITESK